MAATHDLREGLRTLRRQPGFTLAAIVAFALAIGTNTAIFAALHAVILTPLPFADPSRLVMVWRQNPALAQPVMEVSHRHFRDWQVRTRSFERLAAIGSVNSPFTWTMANGERRRIDVAAVSHEFFAVLGASPVLGRVFLPEEDRTNAAGVVILSDAFWTRELACDPAVVGRALTLNDRPFTIVGVMPRGFAFPHGADVWSPVSPTIGATMLDNPTWGVLYIVGRLRPGVQPAQARQELDPLVRLLERERGMPDNDRLSSVVTPLTDYIFGNTRPILLALGGTGVIVLVIACANIIGLLLVRALARRRDSAIRVALGASRWQMLRLWLAESLLLAGGGLIGGILLAWWGSRALVSLAPASTPQLDRIALSVPVVLFGCAVCLLSAIVCGIVPAWVASRLELRESLKDGARDSESRSRRRARHALVIGQLALSMMLLVGAGLMVRSVLNLRQLDLGYVPAGVLAIDFAPSTKDRRRYEASYDALLTQIRALPQVQSAGATYQLPLIYGPIGMDAGLLLEGQAPPPARDWMKNPTTNLLSVTAGYFEAMGTRVLRGRAFTSRDTATSPPVVLLGETAARRLWPGRDAVGLRLFVPGGPRDAQGRRVWQTVVGVVQDTRFRGIDDVRLDVYVPHEQIDQPVQSIVVRTAKDPVRVVADIRTMAQSLDPRAIVGRVRPLETIVATAMAPWRFGMLLFSVLAAVAFALALTGLFGVISYSVAQRHREIAVRLALGALPAQMRALVVRQGAALVLVGLALGLAGAFVVSRALTGVLFDLSPADTLTYIVVLLLVAASALSACHLAARRTTRIDPMALLR